MTAADLSLLPEPCARCTFWEASLTDLAAPVDHLDRRSIKTEWAEAVTRHWGYCGVLAYQDDAVIGHLSLAPAMYVPRLGAFATTPVSADAAVIMSAQVVEEFRGRGIGRQLMQSAASLVARRDIRALEAIGTYTDGPSCMLPTGWLEAVGFQVVRPHPITPRLRMNLQTTVRWRPDLGAAWNRLTGLVAQPGGAPEPAAYAHRTSRSSRCSRTLPDLSCAAPARVAQSPPRGGSPVSGTRIGVSAFSVSPRKNGFSRAKQAIISGTPRASMPIPMTKMPPMGPNVV